ncbi:MAG: universal stress protein [Rhodococcus sp. (in: high G+C Gram-positive bacteria)]
MSHFTAPFATDGRFAVILDGAPTDADIVEWAARLARRAHSSLRLIYLLPAPEWSAAMAASMETSDYPSRLRHDAELRLQESVQSARDIEPGIEVDSRIVELSASEMAASVSADSTMLILGAPESGPVRDIVFGRPTTTVVNSATCPTLVWRARRDNELNEQRPVVVGVDGSDPSKRALGAAFDLANILGVELLAVHVGAVSEADESHYATSVEWKSLREAEHKWLQSMVGTYRDRYPSVSVRVLAVGASAARELRALSGTAQVLVVGSRGRGRLSGAVLGSVSQNLIHHAECPVLVVH